MTKKKSFIRLSPVGGSDVRVGVTSLTGESQTNLKKKEKQKLMKIVATPSVRQSGTHSGGTWCVFMVEE